MLEDTIEKIDKSCEGSLSKQLYVQEQDCLADQILRASCKLCAFKLDAPHGFAAINAFPWSQHMLADEIDRGFLWRSFHNVAASPPACWL